MSDEKDQKLLLDAANNLGEFFDAVIVFAYKYEPEKDRFITLDAHSGGIMPMRAVVEDWLNAQKQYAITMADMSQRGELGDDEDEGGAII